MIVICNHINYRMCKHIAAITAVCLFLCLGFNCTFPTRKVSELEKKTTQNNGSALSKHVHTKSLAQRTRKMVNKIGNACKRFKDSNSSKYATGVASDDLKQYEQMVIMKKYPYLDLKDLISRFTANSIGKRGKVNVKLTALNGLESDPSICEGLDEVLNVEIMSRGLSGFAIPPPELSPVRLKPEITKENNHTYNEMHTVLKGLKDDLLNFEANPEYKEREMNES